MVFSPERPLLGSTSSWICPRHIGVAGNQIAQGRIIALLLKHENHVLLNEGAKYQPSRPCFSPPYVMLPSSYESPPSQLPKKSMGRRSGRDLARNLERWVESFKTLQLKLLPKRCAAWQQVLEVPGRDWSYVLCHSSTRVRTPCTSNVQLPLLVCLVSLVNLVPFVLVHLCWWSLLLLLLLLLQLQRLFIASIFVQGASPDFLQTIGAMFKYLSLETPILYRKNRTWSFSDLFSFLLHEHGIYSPTCRKSKAPKAPAVSNWGKALHVVRETCGRKGSEWFLRLREMWNQQW